MTLTPPTRSGPRATKSATASTIMWLLACLICSAPATASAADVERFAIIVGNNIGARDDANLLYAEDDAKKVYRVLRSMGGFRPENMLLLQAEDADTVRDALIAMNERIRRHTGPGRPDTILFTYYSGHADGRALHLGDTELALTQVEQLVQGSPATFRVLVVDACRSGAFTRAKGTAVASGGLQRKGGRPAPPVAITMNRPLGGEGMVVLTASTADEDAQESDDIRGSFFTHYLVSGLMGAADGNGDGHIVLEEAYRYAYQHTLRASSKTLAGTQHPTFRYDLSGRGHIVLTEVMPARRRAIVTFPRNRTYLLMRDGADGPVVAEVSAYDRVRRISVAQGRYFVRARARDHLLEGTVELSGGSERHIADDDLQRISYARMVRKGVGARRAVHGAQSGFLTRSSVFAADNCAGAYVGYTWESRYIDVGPRFGACRSFSARAAAAGPNGDGGDGSDGTGGTSGGPTRAQEIDLQLRLARTWDIAGIPGIPGLAASLGLAVGAAWIDDGARVSGGVSDRYRLVGLLGSFIGLSAELTGPLYASADMGVHTYVQKKLTRAPLLDMAQESSNIDTDIAVRISAGIGVRF